MVNNQPHKTRTPTSARGWLALLLTFVLVAAACGDDASDETADPVEPTDATAEPTPEPEPTETPADPTPEPEPTEAPVEPTPEPEPTEAPAEEDPVQSSEAAAPGVDTELFFAGALAGDPVIDDCTLSDGSASQCYTVSVTGTPVNHDVGPFCPTSVTDTADAGGLWLDGQSSYEIDGEFFTELAEIYGDDLWNNIVNEDGSINVIDSAEEFQVAARPDITEEYYYHCVDGNVEWLDGGVQPEHSIQVPVTPTLTGQATVEFAEGAHSTLGVTFNGAMLSGSADMSAILASYTIAAFDDCGGHINPALGYHVHGTAGCSDVGEAPEGETPPFAYAIDGFTVHAPYADPDSVELDECNGHTTEEYGYHYHANSLELNGTLTCLNGLIAEGQAAGGGAPGGGRPGPPGGG